METDLRRRKLMQLIGSTGFAITLTQTASASDHNEKSTIIRAMPERHGPLKTGLFEVQIDDVEVAGWNSVTIPGIAVEQGTYREGNTTEDENREDDEDENREDDEDENREGDHVQEQEEGEQDEGDDGERGTDSAKKTWGQPSFDDLVVNRDMVDSRLHDWMQAIIQGQADEGRKEIAVTLMDDDENPIIRWIFEGAWPKEYEPPDLDASADGDVATESVTIAFDRMKREKV